ncbi:MAG: ATP-binding cassette domain-containing protein, partial [Sphaerochaetaceae bacterium]
MMVSGEYLLEMKNVSKRFPGVQALKDVQVNVRPGEVLALMGENGAGKSTLMKCLFGIYKMDQGEIFMSGNPVVIDNPRQALDIGIAMVQQELEQVPHRNVMDNIWLGRYPRKGLLIDDKKMYKDTLQIIELFNMNIDPRAQVNHLSVSTKQMADIVKAVSYNAKIIVLDEPTSSLTEKETVGLFKIIRQLKQEGCGIIYIS